jgi:hypothetical protein
MGSQVLMQRCGNGNSLLPDDARKTGVTGKAAKIAGW